MGWAWGIASFSRFSFPMRRDMTAITSESTVKNRYGSMVDKIKNTTYSAGAVGLAICKRKYVTMADKTTNMVDTIPKKVATLPMIFKFFMRFAPVLFFMVTCLFLSYAFSASLISSFTV